jgi:RNA polymerase sigma-70 factor (ECF subfamily)
MRSVDERGRLSERFEEHRGRLRAVAYRMLGSLTEADDAVQEAWLRLAGTDYAKVENLPAWLTTVVARVSLNMLRSRRTRREESLDQHLRMPDPIVSGADGIDPEQEALLADSVGIALLVVLDTLTPAERLAFVLHDMFAVPFEDIAAMLERSPAAARQLASRARRRVQAAPTPDRDVAHQWVVVNAFFAAARDGDFDALVAVLDPDIVLRADGGTVLAGRSVVIHGARDVAAQALSGAAKFARFLRPALVNGVAGAVAVAQGRVLSVLAFTVVDGRIVAMDVLYDPDRLAGLDIALLDGSGPSRTPGRW